MARTRRQVRKGGPPVIAPSVSFRFVVIATMGFISWIGVMIFLSFSGNKNAATKISKVRFDSPEEIPDRIINNLDAVLVLGGGLPTTVDEPPIFTQKRCDHAVQVVQRHQAAPSNLKRDHELPILCLSAGTAHLPQFLSADGLPVWEATSSAAYLLKNYPTVIDKSQLYVETTSYDTIGNAFYARASFTDINGWRNLLVVTNEFHMNRTQAIFDWIFGLDSTSDNPNHAYRLYYLAPPNVGLTEAALQARKEREAKSQRTVETILSPKYTSMKGVWTFLTQEHSLYTAHKLVDRGHGASAAQVDESIKWSYGLNNNKRAAPQQPQRGTDSL